MQMSHLLCWTPANDFYCFLEKTESLLLPCMIYSYHSLCSLCCLRSGHPEGFSFRCSLFPHATGLLDLLFSLVLNYCYSITLLKDVFGKYLSATFQRILLFHFHFRGRNISRTLMNICFSGWRTSLFYRKDNACFSIMLFKKVSLKQIVLMDIDELFS